MLSLCSRCVHNSDPSFPAPLSKSYIPPQGPPHPTTSQGSSLDGSSQGRAPLDVTSWALVSVMHPLCTRRCFGLDCLFFPFF